MVQAAGKRNTFHNLFELLNIILPEPNGTQHEIYDMKFKYSSGTPTPDIMGMYVCVYVQQIVLHCTWILPASLLGKPS